MKYLAIGEMCELLNGFAFKSNEYVSEGIRVIRIANVQKGYIEDSSPCFYPEDQKYAFEKFMLRKNDLLVSLTGNVGRVGLLPEGMMPAALNQRVACLRIKDKYEIDKKYLFHLLNSNYFENACIESSNGAAQKNLSTNWLKKFCVPVPTSDEQKDIARIFDSIIELIYLNKNHLEKLDELVKSRFVEMFGDPCHHSRNWNQEKLSKHLTVIGGFAFKSSYYKEEGIPVLRIGNINSGEFCCDGLVFWEEDPKLEKYKVFPGDIVISLTGTVGKGDYGNVCILGADYPIYYLNQRNAKLDLDDSINAVYLSELLKFPEVKSKLTNISRGVRQANISNKDILNLQVAVPPLSLQQEFADFVYRVDKLKFDFDFLVSFSIPSICLFCLKLDP